MCCLTCTTIEVLLLPTTSFGSIYSTSLLHVLATVPGRQGRQKIILQKNAEKINKIIKYFVEINKNEVNKNCRQKKQKKSVAASKIQC
jgi:hypothetical protein